MEVVTFGESIYGRHTMNLLTCLHKQFVIPVIRETVACDLESICVALAEGGLNILEIALMSEASFDIIKKLSKQSDLLIGAGTVLTATQATKAIAQGASFLVSPGFNIEVLEVAQKNNIPAFPGVLTPTEVMQAKQQGFDFLKIFPISAMGGAAYLKLLQEPFPTLKWMASGGISLQDLKDYINAGATCICLGNQLTSKRNANDWQALSQLAEMHVESVKAAKMS